MEKAFPRGRLRSEEMDRYIAGSPAFVAALMAVGVLLCACRPSQSSLPTPAAQQVRHNSALHNPAPVTDQQRTAPASANTNDHSTATMAALAVAGGMMLSQEQLSRVTTCTGEGCESNPVPFLKLQPMQDRAPD